MFLLTLDMPIHMLENFSFFLKYCTAFYGSKMLPLFNNCMDDVYIAWKIAMCKVFFIKPRQSMRRTYVIHPQLHPPHLTA